MLPSDQIVDRSDSVSGTSPIASHFPILTHQCARRLGVWLSIEQDVERYVDIDQVTSSIVLTVPVFEYPRSCRRTGVSSSGLGGRAKGPGTAGPIAIPTSPRVSADCFPRFTTPSSVEGSLDIYALQAKTDTYLWSASKSRPAYQCFATLLGRLTVRIERSERADGQSADYSCAATPAISLGTRRRGRISDGKPVRESTR